MNKKRKVIPVYTYGIPIRLDVRYAEDFVACLLVEPIKRNVEVGFKPRSAGQYFAVHHDSTML